MSGRGPKSRDDRRHPRTADPGTGGVEIEELPAQRVLPRGRARLGLGGALALGAAVVLLAAGLGLWGGRPQPTPGTAGANPSGNTSPSEAPAFTGEPQVTPDSPCGAAPQGAPEVVLEVNGRPTPGAVALLDPLPDPALASAGVKGVPLAPPARVEIRSDVVAELWIVGGACAVAWTIDLVADFAVHVLERLDNPERVPELASQNRFKLPLTPYAGRALDLRATLVLPAYTAQATWPIRVLPFVPPAGVLSSNRGAIRTVAGCDVVLVLGNGWNELQNPCAADVVEDPGSPTRVKPGQRLEFRFDHEDWQVDAPVVVCGSLSQGSFMEDATPGCRIEPEIEQFSFSFAAPREPGELTLAMSTCGTQVLADATNHLCGRWYVNIEVR